MAWTRQLLFVTVGEEVQSSFINKIIGNINEDDVAKVSAAGDLIVATGLNTGEKLEIGDEGDLLKSTTSSPKIEWASPTLSGSFVTWSDLKTHLGI